MGSLLIVTGPPGSGKSTIASILATRTRSSVLFSGDLFYGFLARGMIDPWLPEADNQNQVVAEASAAAAGRLVRDYLAFSRFHIVPEVGAQPQNIASAPAATTATGSQPGTPLPIRRTPLPWQVLRSYPLP